MELTAQRSTMLATFASENPEYDLNDLTTLFKSLLAVKEPKKKVSKKVRTQRKAVAKFLPPQPNVPRDTEQDIQPLFPLLSTAEINRILGGKQCLGLYRQYTQIRVNGEGPHHGKITGWIFDPSGENEYLADLERDYLQKTGDLRIVSVNEQIARMDRTFQFGRALGMANNPKGLPARAQETAGA